MGHWVPVSLRQTWSRFRGRLEDRHDQTRRRHALWLEWKAASAKLRRQSQRVKAVLERFAELERVERAAREAWLESD